MATTDKNWRQKEAREMFRMVVNSLLMRLPEGKMPEIEPILEVAKKVVDRAFQNYPPEGEAEPTKLDFEGE